MANKISVPSVLSFERKLACSDAVLSQGVFTEIENQNATWSPVVIKEKSIRGVTSNRLKENEDAKMINPNLQKIDYASLDNDNDTLRVDFSIKVLAGIEKTSACNSFEFNQVLKDKITAVKYDEFYELGKLYAYSILSARFLWRNRLGAENIKTIVSFDENRICVDSLNYPLNKINLESDSNVETLGRCIADVLANKKDFVLLNIQCYVQLGCGQEVYPSQELVQAETSKKKVLYSIPDNLSPKHAALHSQKVGNAIRTIDVWYPEYTEFGPIAVEIYGSVTNLGRAFRNKKGTDFYSLFDGWFAGDKELKQEERLYVLACLIRGGVFGDAKSN